MRFVLLLLALASAIPIGAAQTRAANDPTDPAAPVPASTTKSGFADYRPFREQKPAPWKQVLDEVAAVPDATGHAGHGASATASMAAREVAPAPKGHEGQANLAMPKPKEDRPEGPPMHTAAATVIATGIVQGIDKANGKVKLTHDPIAALGWPKMTMSFRLKESALADQVKEGDAVQFSLEKSSSGYVISGFKKAMSGQAGHDMSQGDKK